MSKTNSSPTNTTQLSQRIIYLKSELAKYKEMVEDYENNYHYSQLRKLKLQNKELREENETMSLQIQKMYTEQKNVEENLKLQLHEKSEELKQSLITQKNKIENITNENKNYQKEISKLKEVLDDFKKNNDKMKLEMTSLKEHLNQKNAELVQLKEDQQKLLIENSKLKEVITTFQTTNDTLQTDIEHLFKENNHYTKEITELKKLITTIKDDKFKLEEILKTKEEQSKVDLSKLQKELFLYKNLNEKLKSDQNALVEEIKIYKEKIEEAKNDYANSDKKHQIELSQAKKQLEGIQTELEEEKKRNSDLKQENNTLKSSTIHLEQNIEEYLKQNEYLKGKIEILNGNNEVNFSSLIKINKELLTQIENIQTTQHQMVTTVNSFNEDFGSLFSMINYSGSENYEVSELLVSLLEHQFKKHLENSLDVEKEDNLESVFHELELKLAKLTKDIESTSQNNNKELD